MVCNRYADIGIAKTLEDKYVLPLFPDVTGSWSIVIDDIAYAFEAVVGELMVVDDNFTENTLNTFQLRRPDGTFFNNTCYRAFVSVETITEE